MTEREALEAVRPDVIEWLWDREENCLRLAREKTGVDRDGWIEDAKFFHLAIVLLGKHPAEHAQAAEDAALPEGPKARSEDR